MTTLCRICNTAESGIVWSGTDAFMLGIPNTQTGVYCYSCAKAKVWEIKHDCKTDESGIVWSGTDAFMLGIPNTQTGVYCYSCAKAKVWKESELSTL